MRIIRKIRNGMRHLYRHIDAVDHEVNFEIPGQFGEGISVRILPDVPVAEIMGIPIHERLKYDTSGTELPPEQDGVLWIVPKHVCDAFPDRHDLAYPDRQVREGNRIVGSEILRLNR